MDHDDLQLTPESVLETVPFEPTTQLSTEQRIAEKALKTCIADYGYHGCASARNWIFANDTTEGEFTFLNCCDLLNLSPTVLRRKIFPVMAENL